MLFTLFNSLLLVLPSRDILLPELPKQAPVSPPPDSESAACAFNRNPGTDSRPVFLCFSCPKVNWISPIEVLPQSSVSSHSLSKCSLRVC